MTQDTPSSTCLRHEACPACASSDAFGIYDDGHGHCFSCGHHVSHLDGHGAAEIKKTPHAKGLIPGVEHIDIPSRSITAAVCRSNDYGVIYENGVPIQVAQYRDATGSRVVAQKLKTQDKKFRIVGDSKAMTLWPKWRWKPARKLLICEGETDLLCWQALTGDKFAAVSVPNGAAAAKTAVAKEIDWVEGFEEVVLCFDNDKAGHAATAEVAALLTPGKARVMRLPGGVKDICDAVKAGLQKELVDAFWTAVPQRPDGIVGDEALITALLNPPATGFSYPWKGLTGMLAGIRRGELVTLTAGTGVGKSLVAGITAVELMRQGCKVGYISLEESLTRTAERLASVEMGRPLHRDRVGVTEELLRSVWDSAFKGKVCVFNHFGSMDAQMLMNRIRYMRIAEGVDFVVLDHLSILVSGWSDGDGDERRMIDNVMTTLRSICEQTGVGMLLICHLRSPDQGRKTHEEGGRPKLSELRGSKAISQLSDAVIAIVRDQMGDESNISEVWVLKNRFTGTVGRAATLEYSPETGLMTETDSHVASIDGQF